MIYLLFSGYKNILGSTKTILLCELSLNGIERSKASFFIWFPPNCVLVSLSPIFFRIRNIFIDSLNIFLLNICSLENSIFSKRSSPRILEYFFSPGSIPATAAERPVPPDRAVTRLRGPPRRRHPPLARGPPPLPGRRWWPYVLCFVFHIWCVICIFSNATNCSIRFLCYSFVFYFIFILTLIRFISFGGYDLYFLNVLFYFPFDLFYIVMDC